MSSVVLSVPGASISEGRNTAIAAAAGPWIAANDAGTHLSADWFETMAARMTDDVDVVSGFSEPLEGAFLASTIGAVITPTLDEIDSATFLPSSRSVAFRKSSWADVGGYPEWLDYCEDLVFDFALIEHGHRIVFEPKAVVGWDARATYRAFFKQYFRYARGDGKANLWRKRHIARYGAYFIGIVLIVLSIVIWNPIPLILLALGGAGYLSKFWRRVWRRRDRVIKNPIASLLLVPLTVVIGDVAKMLGYPVGIAWRREHRES